jgi:hypothetical protein
MLNSLGRYPNPKTHGGQLKRVKVIETAAASADLDYRIRHGQQHPH